jgi:hypothetical protein
MTADYPRIQEPAIDRSRYLLELAADTVVYLDEIEATGNGYWDLERDDRLVARVTDLDGWPSETIREFRIIQFDEDTA